MGRVLGVVGLAAVLAGLLLLARLPPEVTAERANVRRLAAAAATEQARPTPTPYPTPTTVPGVGRTRAEVLAGAAGAWGNRRVDRLDAKLMRLGDWRRVQCCDGGPGVHPDLWVWVVAWWGEDFEPFGSRLRGIRLTWAASVWDALGGPYNAGVTRPFPPFGWDALPDYAPNT